MIKPSPRVDVCGIKDAAAPYRAWPQAGGQTGIIDSVFANEVIADGKSIGNRNVKNNISIKVSGVDVG